MMPLAFHFEVRAFCPTGPGGGIDNSCSPVSKGSGATKEDYARATADVDDEMPGLSEKSRAQSIEMRAQSRAAIRNIENFVDNYEGVAMPVGEAVDKDIPISRDQMTELFQTLGELTDTSTVEQMIRENQPGGVLAVVLATQQTLGGDVNASIEQATIDRMRREPESIPFNPEDIDHQRIMLGPPEQSYVLPGMNDAVPTRTELARAAFDSLPVDARIVASELIASSIENAPGGNIDNAALDSIRANLDVLKNNDIQILTAADTGDMAPPEVRINGERPPEDFPVHIVGTIQQINTKPTWDDAVPIVADHLSNLAGEARASIALSEDDFASESDAVRGYTDDFVSNVRTLAEFEANLAGATINDGANWLGLGTVKTGFIDPSHGADQEFYDLAEDGSDSDRAKVTKFLQSVATERFDRLSKERGVPIHIWTLTPGEGSTDAQRFTSKIWDEWLTGTGEETVSKFRNAVADEFGLPSSRKHEAFFSKDSEYDSMRVLARAQWETAQYALDRLRRGSGGAHPYRDDFIPLYRGIIVPKESAPEPQVMQAAVGTVKVLPDFTYQRNGASSWTTNPSVANSWKGVGLKYDRGLATERVVLRGKVPYANVLSFPLFGKNTANEEEFVLTSAPHISWTAFRQSAPSFDSWDEADHPRGPDGRFIQKPGAKAA